MIKFVMSHGLLSPHSWAGIPGRGCQACRRCYSKGRSWTGLAIADRRSTRHAPNLGGTSDPGGRQDSQGCADVRNLVLADSRCSYSFRSKGTAEGAILSQRNIEPDAGLGPVPFGRRARNPQHASGFHDREPGKVAKLDVSDKNSRSPVLDLKSLQNKNL